MCTSLRQKCAHALLRSRQPRAPGTRIVTDNFCLDKVPETSLELEHYFRGGRGHTLQTGNGDSPRLAQTGTERVDDESQQMHQVNLEPTSTKCPTNSEHK